jgi:hypothetical protein
MQKEMQITISCDSKLNLLEGSKEYRISLPPKIPASDFWSIIVYDYLSQMMIHTEQSWPSVFSTHKFLLFNKDGSIDAWFGPKPDIEKKGNWVKTIPGKQWYLVLRLYYPLESWFDKSWRPGEIEELI